MAERNRQYFREDNFFNIPESGDIFPLKFICTEVSKYGANLSAENYVTEGSRFIRTSDIDDNGKLSVDGVYIEEQIVEEYKLKESDFLISRSGTLGRVYLYNTLDGLCSYAGYLVKYSLNKNIANPKFIFYCTKSNQFNVWLNYSVIEATIGNINGEKYANLPLPIPSLTQQNKIVDYLDQEVAKIDALIEKKIQLINILEEKKKSVINQAITKGLDLNITMKDSGIEWLGEIPKHWKLVKLKYISNLKSGDFLPAENIKEEGGFKVFGGNGERGYFDNYNHKGDLVLIGRQGALCGNINFAYGKFWATEHAIVCNPIALFDYYWLGKQLELMNLNQYSLAAAQPGLSVDVIKNLFIVLPPISEQRSISNYLIELDKNNDLAIKRIRDSIDLLKEKRTAIMSAAVNGELNESLS